MARAQRGVQNVCRFHPHSRSTAPMWMPAVYERRKELLASACTMTAVAQQSSTRVGLASSTRRRRTTPARRPKQLPPAAPCRSDPTTRACSPYVRAACRAMHEGVAPRHRAKRAPSEDVQEAEAQRLHAPSACQSSFQVLRRLRWKCSHRHRGYDADARSLTGCGRMCRVSCGVASTAWSLNEAPHRGGAGRSRRACVGKTTKGINS